MRVMPCSRHHLAILFAPREQTPVHKWMQRFYPPVHNFGEAGYIRNISNFYAGITKGFRCPACRQYVCTEFFERSREFDHARLVRDADECSERMNHG